MSGQQHRLQVRITTRPPIEQGVLTRAFELQRLTDFRVGRLCPIDERFKLRRFEVFRALV